MAVDTDETGQERLELLLRNYQHEDCFNDWEVNFLGDISRLKVPYAQLSTKRKSTISNLYEKLTKGE